MRCREGLTIQRQSFVYWAAQLHRCMRVKKIHICTLYNDHPIGRIERRWTTTKLGRRRVHAPTRHRASSAALPAAVSDEMRTPYRWAMPANACIHGTHACKQASSLFLSWLGRRSPLHGKHLPIRTKAFDRRGWTPVPRGRVQSRGSNRGTSLEKRQRPATSAHRPADRTPITRPLATAAVGWALQTGPRRPRCCRSARVEWATAPCSIYSQVYKSLAYRVHRETSIAAARYVGV